MVLMDGKSVAQEKRKKLKEQIDQLDPSFRKPKLVVILVGNDPSSEIYVRNKQKACLEVGIESELVHFDNQVQQGQLIQKIEQLNNDISVDAILVQFPLPVHLDEFEIMGLVRPDKDVDGFNYQNQGKLVQDLPTIYPCTPLGVVELLKYYEIEISGKNVCMVGCSNIVGKPLGLMLLNLGASVDFCHKLTSNLSLHTINADILITAVGKQNLITKQMVKPGAVVIDIGTIKDPVTGKLHGDVDFGSVKDITSYITPVPGGVGPMTIAELLENTLKLYNLHTKN